MDGESLRELRYRERERKAIENMRRQALLEIQEQREALVQARAEARARQDELDSQERRQRDVSFNISVQRDDTLGTYISPISDSHKLDFAGKLYTPDDSLLTIDVAGSQYSVSPLPNREKEIVIDEQRDVNTQEEEFEKMLKKLKSQIDSSHVDSVTRQKSVLSNPQTEENIIIKKEPDISKSKMSGSGINSRSAEKVAPNISIPLDNDDDDDEESQLRAKIDRMALHQKELEEKRTKMQSIEKEMERRLKDLKETERKERLRALQKQAEDMEYQLFQSQKEDREWQDRIKIMNLETQRLKDRIAENEISVLTHERLPDSSVYDTCIRKNQETDKLRLLEEELKRRETLIKQEMLKEAQENRCADKKAINVENKHREEQIRMQFEKELDKKEKELKDKEMMLQKYKVQRDYQKNIIDPELLKRHEELKKKELCLKKLEQEILGGDNHQKYETKRETETDVTYYMNPDGDSYEKLETKKDTKTKADVTHFLKPYLTQFSGTEPVPKNESSFEDWKAETQCLIKSTVYPESIVSQAIRNSLKGHARKALSTLDQLTNSDGIISKLESLFGNVASGLSILQEFFTAAQNSDETVTMWGLRIEEILQRAIEKGEVPAERRNHLLKDKFWRSLHSFDLKIATKVYFDKITDFEVLRSKVREEERELKTHKITVEKTYSNSNQTVKAPENKIESSGDHQHQPVHTETGPDKLYNDLAKRLEKVENMCSNRQNRRYNRNRKWNDRKNEQKDKSDDKQTEQKSETLNRDRPPLKGK